MFMDNEYIAQNEEAFTSIISSACVCLQMFLEFNYHNDNFASIFNEGLFANDDFITTNQNLHLSNIHIQGEDKVDSLDPAMLTKLALIKNDYIISNLSKILFDDNYKDLRSKFIAQLQAEHLTEEVTQFNQCLDRTNDLPKDIKEQIPSVIDRLKFAVAKDFNQESFDNFFCYYLDREDIKTKGIFLDLLFNYFSRTYDNSPKQSPCLIFNLEAMNKFYNDDKLQFKDKDYNSETDLAKNQPKYLIE